MTGSGEEPHAAESARQEQEDAPALLGTRPPWSAFRAALDAAGFRPRKRLGQNFLLDPNVIRAIARDARVGPGDRVLEVGPGCGFLSVCLMEHGVELLAVEIDPRLARVAAGFLEGRGKARLLVADALASKHRLGDELAAALWTAEPWHFVANLPYAIAAPLLVVLARSANPPQSATVLVQKEVAERLAARPGDRAWGALTAKLARTYRGELLREVGAQLFWPRPRVQSAVCRLERLPGPDPAPASVEPYDRLVGGLFQRRRKTLRAALGGLLGDVGAAERALRAAGIPTGARPVSLAPPDLERLLVALEGPFPG